MNDISRRSLLVALGLASWIANETTSAAQSDYSALAKLPNFTEGVWGNTMVPVGGRGPGARTAPQLRPGVQRSAQPAGESCLPIGIPAVMQRPYPFEFVFEPGRILMLLELDGMTRRIYTDGRSHPEDPDPTYAGHSIGHWDGDSLVVQTVGILPEVQVAPGVPGGEGVQVTERMRLASPDVLSIQTTIDAPHILLQPWTYSMDYPRRRDWSVQEYYCVQNPR